jgi:hypothetical protein
MREFGDKIKHRFEGRALSTVAFPCSAYERFTSRVNWVLNTQRTSGLRRNSRCIAVAEVYCHAVNARVLQKRSRFHEIAITSCSVFMISSCDQYQELHNNGYCSSNPIMTSSTACSREIYRYKVISICLLYRILEDCLLKSRNCNETRDHTQKNLLTS